MRIALSGVPGTGKTTLGRLITQHTFLQYIPEVEDIVAQEDGFKHTGEIREKLGYAGLIDNFFRSLERKVKSDTTVENYVTDKCLLDWGARWFANMWESATDEQHDKVRAAMKSMAEERYHDTIIYLPLHLNRGTDYGMGRTTDANLRYKRSLLLKGLFSEFNVPFTSYEFNFSDPPEKVIKDLGLEEFRK